MEGFRDMLLDTWNMIVSLMPRDDFIPKNCQIILNPIFGNGLVDIIRLDAKDIAQKAKVKWTIEEDENTSFFHGMLKKKHRQLAIRGVFKDGVWLEDPPIVKAEFFDHFSNRFQRTHNIPPLLDGEMPNRLSAMQCESLEHPISRDEIKKAIWDCGGDRTPGPDGFTFKCITTFWDIFEDDVYRFVQEFFRTNYFPKGCNSSFIALIPKVPNANFVSDFQPISLIGCQYKIIRKILANRLSKVIGSVISPEQSVFIKGRNILDGPLILNEVMAWCHSVVKLSNSFSNIWVFPSDVICQDVLIGMISSKSLSLSSRHGKLVCSRLENWRSFVSIAFMGEPKGLFKWGMEFSISWSGILAAINRLKSKGIDLLSLCERKIGNGTSCRF
ncbi:hypothetical protein Tco_0302701 [Tanacetum coccineum]